MRLHRRSGTATSHANQRPACGHSADQSRSLAHCRRTDLPTSTRQSQEAWQPEALRDPGLVASPAFLVALLITIAKSSCRGYRRYWPKLLNRLLLQGFNEALWRQGA